MTRSMTGFARVEREAPWGRLSWELRSVNHRYAEISLRLPDEFRMLEARIREQVGAKIKRGKLECVLRYHTKEAAQSALGLNQTLVATLAQANQEIIDALGDHAGLVDPLEILKWPGVIQPVELDLEQVHSDAFVALDECLNQLCDNREREGEKLGAIILQRCDALSAQVVQVRAVLPDIIEARRKKLQLRLEAFEVEIDNARLEQEIVYLAQRMDVDEELDRLDVHVIEIRRALAQAEPVGRRLDFLMQELNREANTLGSKSIDTQSTGASVEMKVLIEQMREQIQNIE